MYATYWHFSFSYLMTMLLYLFLFLPLIITGIIQFTKSDRKRIFLQLLRSTVCFILITTIFYYFNDIFLAFLSAKVTDFIYCIKLYRIFDNIVVSFLFVHISGIATNTIYLWNKASQDWLVMPILEIVRVYLVVCNCFTVWLVVALKWDPYCYSVLAHVYNHHTFYIMIIFSIFLILYIFIDKNMRNLSVFFGLIPAIMIVGSAVANVSYLLC